MKKIIIIIITLLFSIYLINQFMTEQELENKITFLEAEVNKIKNERLPYDLDIISEKTIEKTVDKFLASKFFEIIWDKIFYWSTIFESADGLVSNGVTFTSEGANLTTDGVLNDTAYLIATRDNEPFLNFGKNQKFRTVVYLELVTTVEAHIKVRDGSAASFYGYGFDILNNTLRGWVANAGNETTINLMTIGAADFYQLEAHFYPNNIVMFYVNGNFKGSLSGNDSNFPKSGISNDTFMYLEVKATAAVARYMVAQSWEFIQEK